MSNESLIEAIKAALQKYSGIELNQPNDDTLLIKCNNSEDGIDITLLSSSREYTLYFNKFHWHFDKNDDESSQIINLIVGALMGNVRVQEFSKNGQPYKWKLEVFDADKEWKYFGTSTVFNADFWTTPQIKYFRNDSSIISVID